MSGTVECYELRIYYGYFPRYYPRIILSTLNMLSIVSLLISDAESPTLVPVYVEPLGD